MHALGLARVDRGHRGRGGRAAVGPPEASDRIASARGLAQEVVHPAHVASLPRLGEVAGHPLRGRLGARSDERTGDHRHGGEPGQGRESTVGEAPSALGGDALHGRDRAGGTRLDGTRGQ
jgi:hypothetical protein